MFAEWLQATALSQAIQTTGWVIPALQSVHIIGIGVVFVSSLMIALRVLGHVCIDQEFEAVWRRFAPWLWTALVVMAVTGLLLVVGEPVREFTATSFWVKMALLALVIVLTLLLPQHGRRAGGGKAVAIAVICVWIAIIFLGRAIAYDMEVWGGLSLQAPT
jgi:uncharacterized membrane protein SirB2